LPKKWDPDIRRKSIVTNVFKNLFVFITLFGKFLLVNLFINFLLTLKLLVVAACSPKCKSSSRWEILKSLVFSLNIGWKAEVSTHSAMTLLPGSPTTPELALYLFVWESSSIINIHKKLNFMKQLDIYLNKLISQNQWDAYLSQNHISP